MTGAHRAALGVGALIGVAGFALGVIAALEHDSIRTDYEEQSALLEASDPRYDAARSDALYDRSLSAARRAGEMGWVSAFGWVVIGLAFRRTGVDDARGDSVTRNRARAAVLIDASVLGLALAFHRTLPDSLGAAHGGGRAFIAAQLAGLALAYGCGALASGVSLGGVATRTRAVASDGGPPGIGRGLGALALFPFGVAWAALSAGPIAPAHLAWLGLRLSSTALEKK